MERNSYAPLCIVPARSKSKGLPNKNITYIGGESLLHKALHSAEIIAGIGNTCLTTDSEVYIEHAKESFSPMILKRSDILSSDNALALDVWKDAILYTKKFNKEYKISLYLEPTSPLRNNIWIKENLEKFLESEDDLWMSVKETDPKFRLEKQFEVYSNGEINHLYKNEDRYSIRQNSKKTYHKDGVFYIAKNNYILSTNSLLGGKIKAIINQYKSANIDTLEDLEYAKFLFKEK